MSIVLRAEMARLSTAVKDLEADNEVLTVSVATLQEMVKELSTAVKQIAASQAQPTDEDADEGKAGKGRSKRG